MCLTSRKNKKINPSMIYKKIFLLFAGLAYCDAANILLINPFSSKSHHIAIRPIGLELARKGHNVTVITVFSEPDPPPNYHEVLVDNKSIWEVMGTERPNVFDMVNKTTEEFISDVLWNAGYRFTEVVLTSLPVKEFLKNDNKFDLVISEQFFQDALNILAYKYKAPLIAMDTLYNCMKHNFLTGNPLQLNTVIYEYLTLKDTTSLWGRLRNVYLTAYEYLWWKHWYLRKQDALVKKYIPNLEEPVPRLYEIQKNISVLFINSHFSFQTPMALLPNIVEIGGMHLSRSEKSLPKDLQDIMDNSKTGVVYMNFGSNIRFSEMEEEKKLAFFKVFKNIKETVLIKWDGDAIENKPENVIIRKWFPQKEIFAHPNVKVFISHGGLIGTQEAIFHGIPILGIPIYADQYNNLDRARQFGFAEILEYHDINKHNLEKALNDILNNESYKIKAKAIAQRFQDRPMTPLDTAVWWCEYVIRHKGADFLKNPARNMIWFKYFMLDIILVVLVFIFALIFITVIILKTLKRLRKSQVPRYVKNKKS